MAVTDLSAVVDEHLLAFEQAAATDPGVPEIDSFLPPPDDPARAEAVRELARVSLELRWTRGEHPDLQVYLDCYPELNEPEAKAAVAYEDYRQRLLAGEPASPDAYRRVYGVDVADWPSPDAPDRPPAAGPTSVASSRKKRNPSDTPTEQLFGLPQRPAPVIRRPSPQDEIDRALPDVGQVFAGFRLVRELGRGAFGRVFLAEQVDLADRPVALKVAPRLAGEVRTLARLQHTNIVPVYSAHRAPPMTAVCMPYFGDTTLAAILFDLANNERPASGRARSRPSAGRAVRLRGPVQRRRPSRCSNRRVTSMPSCGSASGWPTRWPTPMSVGSSTGT